MNGVVAVNQLPLIQNQPVVIHHKDVIEFGISKYRYVFWLQSSEGSDAPVAKKMRRPLVDVNHPTLRDPPRFQHNGARSRIRIGNEKRAEDHEENVPSCNLEKALQIQQEELDVQNYKKEINILQVIII